MESGTPKAHIPTFCVPIYIPVLRGSFHFCTILRLTTIRVHMFNSYFYPDVEWILGVLIKRG
jgi:hypothetical protein